MREKKMGGIMSLEKQGQPKCSSIFLTRKYYLVAERLVSRVMVLLYSYYLSSGRIQNLLDGDSTNTNNLTVLWGRLFESVWI